MNTVILILLIKLYNLPIVNKLVRNYTTYLLMLQKLNQFPIEHSVSEQVIILINNMYLNLIGIWVYLWNLDAYYMDSACIVFKFNWSAC